MNWGPSPVKRQRSSVRSATCASVGEVDLGEVCRCHRGSPALRVPKHGADDDSSEVPVGGTGGGLAAAQRRIGGRMGGGWVYALATQDSRGSAERADASRHHATHQEIGEACSARRFSPHICKKNVRTKVPRPTRLQGGSRRGHWRGAASARSRCRRKRLAIFDAESPDPDVLAAPSCQRPMDCPVFEASWRRRMTFAWSSPNR